MDGANVSWSAVTGVHHYNLRYRELGGSWVNTTTTTTNVNLTSLTSGVNYEWEVQSSCDASNTNVSSWVSEYFTTLSLI